MSLFDDLRCRYPLPVDGANDLAYQTKSFDLPQMEQYEIRDDGTLWCEEYDVEDHSDPNAEGLMRLSGMMSRVNKRWVRVVSTGEVRFYGSFTPDWKTWIEWSAYFVKGELRQLHRVGEETPDE